MTDSYFPQILDSIPIVWRVLRFALNSSRYTETSRLNRLFDPDGRTKHAAELENELQCTRRFTSEAGAKTYFSRF